MRRLLRYLRVNMQKGGRQTGIITDETCQTVMFRAALGPFMFPSCFACVCVFSVFPEHALSCPSIRLTPEYSFPCSVGVVSRVNSYPRFFSCCHLWRVVAYTAVRE